MNENYLAILLNYDDPRTDDQGETKQREPALHRGIPESQKFDA